MSITSNFTALLTGSILSGLLFVDISSAGAATPPPTQPQKQVSCAMCSLLYSDWNDVMDLMMNCNSNYEGFPSAAACSDYYREMASNELQTWRSLGCYRNCGVPGHLLMWGAGDY